MNVSVSISDQEVGAEFLRLEQQATADRFVLPDGYGPLHDEMLAAESRDIVAARHPGDKRYNCEHGHYRACIGFPVLQLALAAFVVLVLVLVALPMVLR